MLPGCTDENACNYDSTANADDGSCEYPENEATNCDGTCVPGNIDLGAGCELEVNDCTDVNAINYEDSANVDDGSCYYVNGCTDPNMFNFDSNADSPVELNYENCIPFNNGCTDDTALNYNSDANTDDGSCYYEEGTGCTNPEALNYYCNDVSFSFLKTIVSNVRTHFLAMFGTKNRLQQSLKSA